MKGNDVQLGVTTWTLPARGPKALQVAAKCGFRFVHVDSQDAGDSERGAQALRSMSRETEVELGGLSVNRLETVGLRDIRKAKSAILRSIDLAYLLGIRYIYLPFFGLAEIDESNVSAAALLAEFAWARATEDVTVAVESGLNAIGTRNLFSQLSHTQVRLLFDAQNPVVRGIDNVDLARVVAPYLGHFVHLKDGRHRLGDRRIGRGTAKIGQVIEALVQSGFRGRYVLENNYQRDAGPRARFDQERVRRFLQENDLNNDAEW